MGTRALQLMRRLLVDLRSEHAGSRAKLSSFTGGRQLNAWSVQWRGRMLTRLRRLFRKPGPSYPLYHDHQLSHDASGATLFRSGEPIWRIAWPEVKTARAFKRDLLTTDLACIEFELASSFVEINEEIPGWHDLAETLHEHLPGCLPYSRWWLSVVMQPFAPSPVTIYERAA